MGETAYPVLEARLSPPLDEHMVREIRDVAQGPKWTTMEIGKVFFGVGQSVFAYWSKFAPSVNPERLRPHNRPLGKLQYNLGEIEEIAHAVARRGSIDGAILAEIVSLIWAMCEIHKVPYIGAESEAP